MIKRALALIALLFGTAVTATADESWNSQHGWIIYEAEDRGAAILSFTNHYGIQSVLIIPGLAGNYDHRGIHDAYWIGRGAGYCEAVMEFPGYSGTQWGRAEVIFDGPSFPTGFTLQFGECMGPLTMGLRAELPR